MSQARLLASLLAAGIAGASSVGAEGASAPAGAAVAAPAAVSALAAQHAARLGAAGIHRIVARPGRGWLDLQMLTTWGPVYFAWPQGAPAAAFDIEVGANGAISVRTEAAGEVDAARYAAAFDAVFAEALRRARDARAYAERPRP